MILFIKDGSRADAGGCSLTPRHVKTSRIAWGSSPYNEGPRGGGGVWNMWQASRPSSGDTRLPRGWPHPMRCRGRPGSGRSCSAPVSRLVMITAPALAKSPILAHAPHYPFLSTGSKEAARKEGPSTEKKLRQSCDRTADRNPFGRSVDRNPPCEEALMQ